MALIPHLFALEAPLYTRTKLLWERDDTRAWYTLPKSIQTASYKCANARLTSKAARILYKPYRGCVDGEYAQEDGSNPRS